MHYVVTIPITGVHTYRIEADSPEEAKELVDSGYAEISDDTDVYEDNDSNNWEIELEST